MKYFKFLMFGLLAVSLATTTSCNKEVVGPQGEQGIQGEQGPKGDDGNANIISTNTITVGSGDWTYSSNGNWYTTSFNVPGISSDVANKGVVQVFQVMGSSNIALPFTVNGNSTFFEFSTSNLIIYNQNATGTTPNPGTSTFRVVIIPPSGLIAHPDVDYSNYEEIAKVFNLD